MLLYRPTGLKELQLVYDSGMRAWPPRLPEQPIFYPVLNFGYAAQIARDWNTKSHTYAGYVTEFEVEDNYASKFERQVVGARQHEELGVPAEELDEFNEHITGRIRVTAAFFGPQFEGFIPETGSLKGKDAISQFAYLLDLLDYSPFDFHQEVKSNHLAVFLNYPFWIQHDFETEGIKIDQKDRIINRIDHIWKEFTPEIPLAPTSA